MELVKAVLTIVALIAINLVRIPIVTAALAACVLWLMGLMFFRII
jgi:hypothetical protein